jgi:predicted transcriptional regulator YdeE
MTRPTPIAVATKTVVGVAAMTTNRDEADPRTARISGLWGQFFQVEGGIHNRTDPDVTLGAYTRYESDHTGAYTLIVGVEVSAGGDVPAGMVALTIPPADYLMFVAEGEMPGALIQTWMAIWKYFADAIEHRRAYTIDFERHDKHARGKVEIYIAIT